MCQVGGNLCKRVGGEKGRDEPGVEGDIIMCQQDAKVQSGDITCFCRIGDFASTYLSAVIEIAIVP